MLKDTVKESAEVFRGITKKVTNKPAVDLASIDALHKLLALALDDFERVLADDRYVVDMDNWLGTSDLDGEPYPGGKCHACLAGSVMAVTLGRGAAEACFPQAYSQPIQRRLQALDALRCGDVRSADGLLHNWRIPPAGVDSDLCASLHWFSKLGDIWDARGRKEGRRLLAKLRLMQAELAEAGL